MELVSFGREDVLLFCTSTATTVEAVTVLPGTLLSEKNLHEICAHQSNSMAELNVRIKLKKNVGSVAKLHLF